MARNKICLLSKINFFILCLSFQLDFVLLGSPGMILAEPGLLSVHPINRRYFQDQSTGKAVYLTGSHTWENFQDYGRGNPPPSFDYGSYLDKLKSWNHNFIRLWRIERVLDTKNDYVNPMPYRRPGPVAALDGKPKFDLDQWNDHYFDRLRDRVIQARNRGIWVGVMLFEGFSVGKKYSQQSWNSWIGHPFNSANNINGVNGDVDKDGYGLETHDLAVLQSSQPAILRYQEAYIKKVIDTLNDLDNVVYEIGNELIGQSTDFQYHMIDLIRSYETGRKNHLIGITFQFNGATGGYKSGTNSNLFNSHADWISPHNERGEDYLNNPPPADGSKIIMTDTDHFKPGIEPNHKKWVWKAFTRGHHTLLMDGNLADGYDAQEVRLAMGDTLRYANRVDLAQMTPQGSRSSTGYALVNAGQAYIIYQPNSGSFKVELPMGVYYFEWFNPHTHTIEEIGQVTITNRNTLLTRTFNIINKHNMSFTPPFSAASVLFLEKQ